MPIMMSWDDINEDANDQEQEDLEWGGIPEGRVRLVLLGAKEGKSKKGDFQVKLLIKHQDGPGATMEYLTVNPKCQPMVKRIAMKLGVACAGQKMFGAGDFQAGLVFDADVTVKEDPTYGPQNNIKWWGDVHIISDPSDDKMFPQAAGSVDSEDIPF